MTTVVQSSTNVAVLETQAKELLNVQTTEILVVDEHHAQSVVLSDSEESVVLVTVDSPIVQGGIQGPPGVPGASTQFEYFICGSSIGSNRAVTVNSSGQLIYPDLNSTTSYIVGLTTQSGSSGDQVEVQLTGTQTEFGWSWTAGSNIFVSVNGTLTETPPIIGQVLCVGRAITPTKIFIDKQPPIYIG